MCPGWMGLIQDCSNPLYEVQKEQAAEPSAKAIADFRKEGKAIIDKSDDSSEEDNNVPYAVGMLPTMGGGIPLTQSNNSLHASASSTTEC